MTAEPSVSKLSSTPAPAAGSGGGLPPAAGDLVIGRFMTRLRRLRHDELSDQARQIVRRAPPAGDRQAGAQP